MILFICLVLLSILLFLTKRIKGTLLCVNSLFNIMWFVCIGISSLKLYGLYSPSIEIYLYASVITLVFNIVSLTFGYIGTEAKIFKHNNEISYNFKLLYALNIFSYVFAARHLVFSISILKKYGFALMRYYTSDSAGLFTTTNLILFQWVILPIFILTIIINAISLSMKKMRWPLLVMTLVDVVLYVLLFGGRYIIVRFGFITCITYIWYEKGRILKMIKYHKKLVVLFISILFVLGYITSLRSISNLNFVGNIVTYFTGSFSYTSRLLENNELTQPLYGRAVFGGIYNFTYAVLKILFGIEYKGSDTIITAVTYKYLPIGEFTLYNSLTSIIYPFLCDFGVFGLIIDSIIFGLICNTLEKKAYKSLYIGWSILYLYIMFVVFDSVLQYDLLGPINIVLLILTIMTTYNARKKDYK